MTRQTWTAVVSAVVFIALAAVIAFAPIPFVAWTAGETYDVLGQRDGKPVIQINGIETYGTTGQMRMVTVSQTRADAALSLPEALFDYVMPNRDVLPRESIYPAGKSATQVAEDEKTLMISAQTEAAVAALRAADQPVHELPMVVSVRVSGPSNGKLEPGDLILRVDNVLVNSAEEVVARVKEKGVGQKVVVEVLRRSTTLSVTVDTVGSSSDGRVPTIGITVGTGYQYTPRVQYSVDPNVGGGSGGLMFALAIYDMITPGDLLGGRTVAGTGTIAADGTVGAIGGIQEKIAGAQAAGATVFFVPAQSCADTVGAITTMQLVKVSTLSDAINALPLALDPNPSKSPPAC